MHLWFALNQSHVKLGKDYAKLLGISEHLLLELYQILQVNYAIIKTFSIKKVQEGQVVAINKNVPLPHPHKFSLINSLIFKNFLKKHYLDLKSMALFHPIYHTKKKKGILSLLIINQRKESDNLERDPISFRLPIPFFKMILKMPFAQ